MTQFALRIFQMCQYSLFILYLFI